MTTPSVDKSHSTTFHTQLEKLTQEGVLGSYLVVEDDGSLHKVGALRIFWESSREFFGYTNRADAGKVQDKVLSLISENESEIKDSADLVIALAKKAGIVSKQQKPLSQDQLIQQIRSKALEKYPPSSSLNLAADREIKEVEPEAKPKEVHTSRAVLADLPKQQQIKPAEPEQEEIDREDQGTQEDAGSTTSQHEGGQHQDKLPAHPIEDQSTTTATLPEETAFAAPIAQKADVSELQIPDSSRKTESPQPASEKAKTEIFKKPFLATKIELLPDESQKGWSLGTIIKTSGVAAVSVAAGYLLYNALGSTESTIGNATNPVTEPNVNPNRSTALTRENVTYYYPQPQTFANASVSELTLNKDLTKDLAANFTPPPELQEEKVGPEVSKVDILKDLPLEDTSVNPRLTANDYKNMPDPTGRRGLLHANLQEQPELNEMEQTITENQEIVNDVETVEPFTPIPAPIPSDAQKTNDTAWQYLFGAGFLGGIVLAGYKGYEYSTSSKSSSALPSRENQPPIKGQETNSDKKLKKVGQPSQQKIDKPLQYTPKPVPPSALPLQLQGMPVLAAAGKKQGLPELQAGSDFSKKAESHIKEFSKTDNYKYLGGTSDHTWKTYTVGVQENGKGFKVKVGTWNLMDQCTKNVMNSDGTLKNYGNNPLNLFEGFQKTPLVDNTQDYLNRKMTQFEDIRQRIKSGEFGSVMNFQEVDFLEGSKYNPPNFAPAWLKPKKDAYDAFMEMLDECGWKMITTDRSKDKKTQDPLITIYDPQKLETTQTMLSPCFKQIPYKGAQEQARGGEVIFNI